MELVGVTRERVGVSGAPAQLSETKLKVLLQGLPLGTANL